jgi:hypothetical protein
MAKSDGSVQLAQGQSASSILFEVLAAAVAHFPAALDDARLPAQQKAFRTDYPRCLPRFEAARLASTERLKIAQHLVESARARVVWRVDDQDLPLKQLFDTPGDPLALQAVQATPATGWSPSLIYRGKRWPAEALADYAGHLVSRNMITPAAGTALTWLHHNALTDGALRLDGRKIVVLGANAEMAPTRSWLEAGASVLWLDVAAPPPEWTDPKNPIGDLHWCAAGADLLRQPTEILSTIRAFAGRDLVDLALYAYAPGQAREMRLTASMSEIVNALPQALINSITMLVSPTTPTQLGTQDLDLMQARRNKRPGWEAALDQLGLLGGWGSEQYQSAATTRTVVDIQGASYQAAQYLGKILTAECWANLGQPESDEPKPLRVSANTAAITRTRSLDHPVFAAAFGGAAALGVETFTPRQSRQVNGLLAVHDWLHPAMPVPGQIRVHGGIHTLPYPLSSALKVAAAIGFARSPRLLLRLMSGSA